jgi:phospholipid/cholesterol/gamma-HCH transport system substrate-binding protein
VRIAGLNAGRVARMALDERYRALVTLEFSGNVGLPEDSSAMILTDGLFGQKFIEVQPGGADAMLKSGGRISYVQDSVILEDLINTIVARAKASRGEAP